MAPNLHAIFGYFLSSPRADNSLVKASRLINHREGCVNEATLALDWKAMESGLSHQREAPVERLALSLMFRGDEPLVGVQQCTCLSKKGRS